MKRFLLFLFFVFAGFFALSGLAFAVDAPADETVTTSLYDDDGGIADFDTDIQDVDKVANENPLAHYLCQVIIMFQGRIGRAVAAGAIVSLGIMFLLGKVTVPVILFTTFGFALMFGSKNIALLLLPRYVTVMDENNQKVEKTIAADEIISYYCGEI